MISLALQLDNIADAFEDTHWYSTFTTELQASLDAMTQPDADFLDDLDMHDFTYGDVTRDTGIVADYYDDTTGEYGTGELIKWQRGVYLRDCYAFDDDGNIVSELSGNNRVERAYIKSDNGGTAWCLQEHIDPRYEVETNEYEDSQPSVCVRKPYPVTQSSDAQPDNVRYMSVLQYVRTDVFSDGAA